MNHRTILCNTTTQVMGTIPWTRAIGLITSGKAISIRDTDMIVTSPSTEMFVPDIVMLNKYVDEGFRYDATDNRAQGRPISKRKVHIRDNWECAYCGLFGDTVDHIVPKAHGGSEEWDNVITACFDCNNLKGDTLLTQLGWQLRYEPQPFSKTMRFRNEQEVVDTYFREFTGSADLVSAPSL